MKQEIKIEVGISFDEWLLIVNKMVIETRTPFLTSTLQEFDPHIVTQIKGIYQDIYQDYHVPERPLLWKSNPQTPLLA